jgi:hypothetical protein
VSGSDRASGTGGSGTGRAAKPAPGKPRAPRAGATSDPAPRRTAKPAASGRTTSATPASRTSRDPAARRAAPDPDRRGRSARPEPADRPARAGRPDRGEPRQAGTRAPDPTRRGADRDRRGRAAASATGTPRPAASTRAPRPTSTTSATRSPRPAAARTSRPTRPDRSDRPERPDRPRRPDGPALPPGADPRLLPSDVRRELRPLQDVVADRVAGHLVAAGQLIDEDPAAAYEHAKHAKTLAGRIGAVREAVGVTAYAAGDYAAALAELKAARRITGLPDQLPLIADCERALGHPDRALAVAADPDRKRLDRAAQVELSIVTAGARRDLGQPEAAVLALQGPDLDTDTVEDWTPRLWYAFADALLAAGRRDEAASWFAAVAAVDEEGATDAEERLAELSRPAGE